MNDSSFFAKLLTRVAILNAHQGQICFADLVGREGFAYYTQTELRCVGSPRSLSAGPSGLTAYSSLLGRRSLASNPLNYSWWAGKDLNLRRLRRQIYSLLPLTTRPPTHFFDLEPARGVEPPTS